MTKDSNLLQDTHPANVQDSAGLNRRLFLKAGSLGLGASATLATVATTGCSTTQVQPSHENGFDYLRNKDIEIFSAITPVVLSDEFNGDRQANQKKIAHFLPHLDKFMMHSSTFTKTAFADFLDDLYFAPTRILLTGIWRGWDQATPVQVENFLINWRDSSFNLLRGGYCQITQLISVVWYATPENWAATNYPGPPKHITT
ncbi:MAG: twin-arginine translocation pathway signal protein [Pseudomonadales bacterium]|nr:twin-arginine translocation pathway signal protein [Pseudomonadales bacterium]